MPRTDFVPSRVFENARAETRDQFQVRAHSPRVCRSEIFGEALDVSCALHELIIIWGHSEKFRGRGGVESKLDMSNYGAFVDLKTKENPEKCAFVEPRKARIGWLPLPLWKT